MEALLDHIDWERPERIPEAIRDAVLERDNEQCQACGTNNGLQLHHVWYRSLGGAHAESNLVVVCWKCHDRIHRHEIDIQLHWVNHRWVAFVHRNP